MTFYRIHGLRVECGIPLAADLDQDQVAPPDVTVDMVEVGPREAVGDPNQLVARADDPTAGRQYTVRRGPHGWSTSFTGTAEVRLDIDARSIQVAAVSSTDPASLGPLIGGPVLNLVSIARGRPLLHAGAVAFTSGDHSDDVWGFVGHSGAGKSTLSRLLADHEAARLFSDDALRVDVTEGLLVAHRGTTTSRLRSPAALSGADRARPGLDGRYTTRRRTIDARETGSLQLLAIPALSASLTSVVTHRLTSGHATALLSSAQVIQGLLDPDLLAAHLRHCAALVAYGLPVVVIGVPWTAGETDLAGLTRDIRRKLSCFTARRGEAT